MSLLRPKNHNRKRRRRLPERTHISCVYNGHQVSWCMGLCTPVNGFGFCGRLATHSMKGRTQRAIAAYKARHGEGK